MKKMFKDVAFKVSAFLLWYPMTPWFNTEMDLWKEILIMMVFYVCLDFVCWGLKKD